MTDWLSFSPRTKSIALLVATLLLGIILGAVLNAWWARERFDRLRRLRTPGGFEQIVTRTLEPTSPEQRQQIEAVVGRTAQRLDSLRARHWREVRATVDSMRVDLAPILTDEQRETLTRRIRMHRHRSGFRPPGRPPGADSIGPPRRRAPR
jgi:hypothetical protein